jgi:hypothetical protein
MASDVNKLAGQKIFPPRVTVITLLVFHFVYFSLGFLAATVLRGPTGIPGYLFDALFALAFVELIAWGAGIVLIDKRIAALGGSSYGPKKAIGTFLLMFPLFFVAFPIVQMKLNKLIHGIAPSGEVS